MRVELDVFSGRPNPVWDLDEQARGRVLTMIDGFPRSDAEPPAKPGLGYRGFLLRDGPTTWRAFGGLVATRGLVRDDPARALERHLLEGLPHSHANLREMIAAQLE